MATKLTDLFPYKSLVLGEFKTAPAQLKTTTDEILDDVVRVLGLDGTNQDLKLLTKAAPQTSNGLEAGFLHFRQNQQAAWTADPAAVDVVNHLVLVCRQNHLVAIFVSDQSMRNRLTKRFDDTDGKGLAMLQRIPPLRLNAAFVRGQTRTLWLTGIHRRTAIKADAKVLSGIDLRDALNPLDDQTYNFTAARCLATILKSRRMIGVAPRRSRVWFGLSKSWADFCAATKELLSHLEATKKNDATPLPVLVTPVASGTNVADAFDVSFQPPELANNEVFIPAPNTVDLEKWAYESNFEVVKAAGADFSARLSLNKKSIGEFDFNVDLSNPDNVLIQAKGRPASKEVKESFDQALRLCNRPDWINIRYDSGHTISDGSIHEIRYRDLPFANFDWVDFKKFDVDCEKPNPLTAIGKKWSLFCWVQQNWPIQAKGKSTGGWLVCDDGSMEIADFIHLDLGTAVPLLSLIHVKGAGSASSSRSISVSKYEVVTGQAVKNLRNLDRLILEEGVKAGLGKKISKLVWFNRKLRKRDDFLKVLGKLGAGVRKQVIILQPQVTKPCHDAARANTSSRDAARLRQLDTLLFGAEMSCRGVQAELRVIGALK